jgi:hypothetical protein
MINAQFSSVAPLHRPIYREAALRPLRALRGVVLLGGSVWMSGLRAAIARPVVELPVAPQKSILDVWCERVAELGESIGRAELPIRVVLTQGAPLPSAAAVMLAARASAAGPATPAPAAPAPAAETRPRSNVAIERDAVAFRGTGGVLRDLANGEPDDGFMVVANAAQLVLEPLAPQVMQLAACDADVGFIAHYDGTPSRLMLVRSRCLRVLPPVGFVDLMEQGLPLIAAADHSIHAVQRAHASSLPVRTRQGYIAALQRYHRFPGGRPGGSGEDWRASFALAEDGAQVDRSACLHDSVVLRGARVERGAVVARSVVCPGGVVPRGAVVVDQVVGGAAAAAAMAGTYGGD